MKGTRPYEGGELELMVLNHATLVVGRDPRARGDLASEAEITPPDLIEWLLSQPFTGFELVAHARIGAHHIFKTKFIGPTILVVVQARWATDASGGWRIREAEVARTEGAPSGAARPAVRSGEI
jgi:hypothetical protein